MKRFRLLQCCNRQHRARLWVCPWLRDNKTDMFDEWIVHVNRPVNAHAGVEYFVDISFKTKEVAITPAGSLEWVFFTRSTIDSIKRPEREDYERLGLVNAPYLPWIVNNDFSPINRGDCQF